ncbi:uncharacterized protein BDR25DRAFT_323966 [Lindgomyces ingoldianus]|uniref:Uncharacterized protein n=1 Tax=Lindgomyces ingoldianus TaxID=673940 RepID=A0ACB6R2M9_9PLEO|nr:uncharacterized protein BDR25DRAFT_323966 [Lindgomyces ingoldianus]KAF2473431.1 hypothetical protein BDR25DRAFT_323966 [Lindgomyces ingoldianus]
MAGMLNMHLTLVLLYSILFASAASSTFQTAPKCRFSPQHSQQDILTNGHFHQDNVGYNTANEMTYDGTLLDPRTGLNNIGGLHPFNAARKESLHVMVLTHAIAGNRHAARFLSPEQPDHAATVAVDILEKKLDTCLKFNRTYPGFVEAFEQWKNLRLQSLAKRWQKWLDYTKVTAEEVFYNGIGRVCAVESIRNQSVPIGGFNQSYICEGTQALNDPYEGEPFTLWLYLFSPCLTATDKADIWAVKRPQLVLVEWDSNTSLGNVTVGFSTTERARTCNSYLNNLPGMYASVNNITDSSCQIRGYILSVGIPSTSNQTVQELDVVTPYAVFPTILFNRSIGLAWWKNMVDGKGMQNPYGSTKSERVDGGDISSFVSWNSKITTVTAILGGYENSFGQRLRGENVELCLPKAQVAITVAVRDYESCRAWCESNLISPFLMQINSVPPSVDE